MDAVHFVPMLSKYADTQDISFYGRPTTSGDVCFALHYPALLSKEQRKLHKHNIVIHGADLPSGRGRSPIHWQVEEGKNEIPLTLFEMGEGADDGDLYLKDNLKLDGTELLPDIRLKIIRAEIDMIDCFLSNKPKPIKQKGVPDYYLKRTRKNQKLDVNKTISEQFNKMRVADNNNYPLWFELNGVEYELRIHSKAERLKLFRCDLDPEPSLDVMA